MQDKDDRSASISGRPRSVEADDAILEAASQLLANDGYEGLSYEAIGKLAGVGRPTIYRRWPTKAHLAAAVAYGNEKVFREPEGDVRERIAAIVRQVYDLYSRPEIAAASVGLISALQKSEELRDELHTPAEIAAREQLRAIINRAKRQGEAREATDPDILFDMIVGSLIFRLVFSSLPTDNEFVSRISDHFWRVIRSTKTVV